MNDDRDLARLFAEGRRHDLNRTPPYERVRQHRGSVPSRGPKRRLALALGLAGLVAGLGVTLWRSRSVIDETEAMVLAQQVSEWQSQTDFLLPHSGIGDLKTIPRIGEMTRWYPLEDSVPSVASGRKEIDSL